MYRFENQKDSIPEFLSYFLFYICSVHAPFKYSQQLPYGRVYADSGNVFLWQSID